MLLAICPERLSFWVSESGLVVLIWANLKKEWEGMPEHRQFFSEAAKLSSAHPLEKFLVSGQVEN